jgi:hypothetical protein
MIGRILAKIASGFVDGIGFGAGLLFVLYIFKGVAS